MGYEDIQSSAAARTALGEEKAASLELPTRPSAVLERVLTAQTREQPVDDIGEDLIVRSKTSSASRAAIVVLVVLGNLIQIKYTSMFSTMAGGYEFARRLGRTGEPDQANWLAAAYSLTQSAFVLISGRLGAVFGHDKLLLTGGAILIVFSIANCFCTSYNTFVAVRALTGIGGGIIMPNAVATLTIMVPPGRGRNMVIATFAASPPVGAMIGALLAGVFLQSRWLWLFVFVACVAAAVFGGLFWMLPREDPVDKEGSIDYIGAALGLGSLALFNFSWNQAPSAGWQKPYVGALAGVSVLLFLVFLVWESRYAEGPIMPLRVFATPTFMSLIIVVLLVYMSVGITLWYMVAWQQLLRGWTVLRLAVGWIPYSIGASLSVSLAAWLIPRLAAQYVMAVGILAQMAAGLILATMPRHQLYWAQVFPATVLSSICPDFVFVAAQVIASSSVGKRDQGVAGSLVGTLNLYGSSLGLGFAGTINQQLVAHGVDQITGFRAALYFGAALCAASLVLDAIFVRMPKNTSEGWEQEQRSPPDLRDTSEGEKGTN